MQAIVTDQLPFTNLPTKSLDCHKFDQVDIPLCSVGKFCDNGMRVLFDINNVWVYHSAKSDTLLMGYCDMLSKLCMIPLDQPVQLPNMDQKLPLETPVQLPRVAIPPTNQHPTVAIPPTNYLLACTGSTTKYNIGYSLASGKI